MAQLRLDRLACRVAAGCALFTLSTLLALPTSSAAQAKNEKPPPLKSQPLPPVIAKEIEKSLTDWKLRAPAMLDDTNVDFDSTQKGKFALIVIGGAARYVSLEKLLPPTEKDDATFGLKGSKVAVPLPTRPVTWRLLGDNVATTIHPVGKPTISPGQFQVAADGSVTFKEGIGLMSGTVETLAADKVEFLTFAPSNRQRPELIWKFSPADKKCYQHQLVQKALVPGYERVRGRKAVFRSFNGEEWGAYTGGTGQGILLTAIEADGRVRFRHDQPTRAENQVMYPSSPALRGPSDGDVCWTFAPGYFVRIDLDDGRYEYDPKLRAFVHSDRSLLPIGDGAVADLTAAEVAFLKGTLTDLYELLKKNASLSEPSKRVIRVLQRASALQRKLSPTWDDLTPEDRLDVLRIVVAQSYRKGSGFAIGKKISHAGEPDLMVKAGALVESEAPQVMLCAHLWAALARLEYDGHQKLEKGFQMNYTFHWQTLTAQWKRPEAGPVESGIARTRFCFDFDKDGNFRSLAVAQDEAAFRAFGAADKLKEFLRDRLAKAVATTDEDREIAKAVADIVAGKDAKECLEKYLRAKQKDRLKADDWRPWSMIAGHDIESYFRK
ncbi:MAG: hypothetical protein K8T89_04895 [Planctomycetes bacterium]|nr:hypothetical protein [Planctomycetota bacterium]